jgi:hypothetical protein
MYETYAYFWVSNFDCPPEDIGLRLGLVPTESWTKGDQWLPNKDRTYNCWQLCSPLPRDEVFLDRHLEALLKLIESKEDIIDKLSQEFQCGINCVGYYYEEHPGFHLSAELIARLAKIGLDVDFDLYCLSGDDEQGKKG